MRRWTEAGGENNGVRLGFDHSAMIGIQQPVQQLVVLDFVRIDVAHRRWHLAMVHATIARVVVGE